MAKRPYKKKSKKEYTLAEFQAWLEGVEEIQPADWSPNNEQWKMIREKISNIVIEEIVVEVPTAAPALVAQPPQFQLPPPNTFQPPTESGFGAPPVDIGVPDMTPAAQDALSGKLPTEMVPGSDGKVHTPNIDTSKDDYSSSFG